MKTTNANDLFWLARYAHNKLAPIFAELREVEPSAALNIRLVFESPRYSEPWHIEIIGHWVRDGMIVMDSVVTTPDEVDRSADRVRGVIAKLRQEAAA